MTGIGLYRGIVNGYKNVVVEIITTHIGCFVPTTTGSQGKVWYYDENLGEFTLTAVGTNWANQIVSATGIGLPTTTFHADEITKDMCQFNLFPQE